MIHWMGVRQLAQDWYRRARAQAPDDSAAALLAAAAELTGIRCRAVPPGDPLLDGGLAALDPLVATIWYAESLRHSDAVAAQAHEYGHHWIDGARASCSISDQGEQAFEERQLAGVQRVEGYGPRDRREAQANVFGREFLLPTDVLRRWYLDENQGAAAIATRTGLSEAQVWHQLTLALLTPPLDAGGADAGSERPDHEPSFDPSQIDAAHADTGPTLVEAGPGTGKTRTLVGRLEHLLRHEGVPPTGILGLTFSNKAADEMRTRVARTAPEAAPHVWLGTFHTFGLDLLRQYGDQLGLSSNPTVLDPTDALFLLEERLLELELVHYLNLYEPTIALRDILQAISRAKDELVDPDRYRVLAEQMGAKAATEAEREEADKALEVARVYGLYQAHLEREQCLDFGDLIFKSVVLLQTHPNIRDEVRRTYRHILVDEYQDVNYASGVLLREIAGDGRGLWVVGDTRQSIYRFRGAAPRNVRILRAAYPGLVTFPLRCNYRARPEIVAVYTAMARRMQAGRDMGFAEWEVDRPAGGLVRIEVAEDREAEGQGIAREIERQRAAGVAYSEQAVLCRSHTMLARLAERLQAAGIPILYLGDLFERTEVRDLLSLVALISGDGSALLRVAQFPEYDCPGQDILALLRMAHDQAVRFPKALSLAAGAEAISERGQLGLARLALHVEGLAYDTTAWSALASYLFERSTYLRAVLADASSGVQHRQFALYQFLQFAYEQRDPLGSSGWDSKQRFLDYVRRLEFFGEDKQLRQLPVWTERLDAVRLMTIHASKGLEFRAVYMPELGPGYFPANRRPVGCPAPVGMVPEEASDWHDEEEECLFFVGLSRARDMLCLSRARKYGKRPSNPNTWLGWLAGILPYPPDGPTTWLASERVVPSTDSPLLPSTETPDTYEVDALEQYMRCALQYYYERVLKLGRWRVDPPYVRLHNCVYGVLRWLVDERARGAPVDEAAGLARLDELWVATGPVDHPYNAMYLEHARQMLRNALQPRPGFRGPGLPSPIDVPLQHGVVRLLPDQVSILDDGTLVMQRLRTGRLSKSERDKPIYALYQRAARAGGTTPQRIELISLTSGASEPIDISPKTEATRLAKYDEAILGLRAGRFLPSPSERNCPRCPHYFICPAGSPHPVVIEPAEG